jgi:hypothetical protein
VLTIRLSNKAVVFAAVPSPTLPLEYLLSVADKTCVPSTEPLIDVPWKTSFMLCQLPAARVACPVAMAAPAPPPVDDAYKLQAPLGLSVI